MSPPLKVLTGIDLPFEPSCGSVILADDLYADWPEVDHRFIALPAAHQEPWSKLSVALFTPPSADREEGFGPAYTSALAAFISSQLQAAPYALIHLHHLSYGMANAMLQLNPKQPIIAFCHGTDLLAATTSARHAALVRATLDRAAACVFPTEAMASLARQLAPQHRALAHVIPWGIPDAALRLGQQRKLDSARPLRLLYAGRWTADKGGKLAIDALEQCEISHQLVCISPPELHPALHVELAKRQLHDRVELWPYMPRPTLWARFARVDALIIPSLNVEAFCLLAVEAMACGLPVVYANTSGLAEVIAQAGLAFQAGQAAALALQLDNLARDPALYHHLSARGLERAASFPLHKMRRGLDALNHQVMADRS